MKRRIKLIPLVVVAFTLALLMPTMAAAQGRWENYRNDRYVVRNEFRYRREFREPRRVFYYNTPTPYYHYYAAPGVTYYQGVPAYGLSRYEWERRHHHHVLLFVR